MVRKERFGFIKNPIEYENIRTIDDDVCQFEDGVYKDDNTIPSNVKPKEELPKEPKTLETYALIKRAVLVKLKSLKSNLLTDLLKIERIDKSDLILPRGKCSLSIHLVNAYLDYRFQDGEFEQVKSIIGEIQEKIGIKKGEELSRNMCAIVDKEITKYLPSRGRDD